MAQKKLGKNLLIGGLVIVAGAGAYNMFSDSDVKFDMSTPDTEDETSTSNIAYAYDLVGTDSNHTIDDDGETKENKEFEIEVPLSSINGTSSDVNYTISTKMLLDEGVISSDDLFRKEISFGFDSDIQLEDADGYDITLIDWDNAELNGETDSTVVSYDSTNDEDVVLEVPFNPREEDVFNELKNLEDNDDEYEVTLTSGLNKDIKLIFVNDIEG